MQRRVIFETRDDSGGKCEGKKFSEAIITCCYTWNGCASLRATRASCPPFISFHPKPLPVVVFEVVDTLPFDGLLQDLRPAATELLPHLHQSGGEEEDDLSRTVKLYMTPICDG